MLLVHFVDVIESDTLKKKFSVLALEVKQFLKWVIKIYVSAASNFYEIMKKEVNIRCKPLEKSIFAKIPDLVLREIGTEQVQYILHAS